MSLNIEPQIVSFEFSVYWHGEIRSKINDMLRDYVINLRTNLAMPVDTELKADDLRLNVQAHMSIPSKPS